MISATPGALSSSRFRVFPNPDPPEVASLSSVLVSQRYFFKRYQTFDIIPVSQFRILAMKHLTKPAHIAIGYTRISCTNILSTFFFCRTGYRRCTVHFLPLDLTAMQIPLVILHIDFPDLSLTINVVLIYLPWIAAAEPAGRTILTTSCTAIERRTYDLLTLFFCCILD